MAEQPHLSIGTIDDHQLSLTARATPEISNTSHDLISLPVITDDVVAGMASTANENLNIKEYSLEAMVDASLAVQAPTQSVDDAVPIKTEMESTFSTLSTLEEFIFFPRLPPELRQYIWSLAYESRCFHVAKNRKYDYCVNYSLFGTDPYVAIPAILHANRESRLVAKKGFKVVPSKNGFIYVRWESDQFHITMEQWVTEQLETKADISTSMGNFQRKCRYLIFKDHALLRMANYNDEFEVLRHFGSLKRMKCLMYPSVLSSFRSSYKDGLNYILNFPMTRDPFHEKYPLANWQNSRQCFCNDWKEGIEFVETSPRHQFQQPLESPVDNTDLYHWLVNFQD